MRPLVPPSSVVVVLTSEYVVQKPPSVEKLTTPSVELAGPPNGQIILSSDAAINVGGGSQVGRAKPIEKRAPEPKKFVPSFIYKGKPINAEHSAFESYSVAFNLFNQGTLPKDEKVLHEMSDHDLKRDGFYLVLKVY